MYLRRPIGWLRPQQGGVLMYGLVVELEIDMSQADRAVEFLHQVAVPTIKQGPGFVSGTWMRSRDGSRTRSVILFEDEKSAEAAEERARQGPLPGAPTRFVSAEVFEVMAQA
jgi:hypothetical protein